MKKIVSLFLILSSFALSARALDLTLGGSVGYLVDSEEAYSAVRVGVVLKNSSSIVHSTELEIGYTEDSESRLRVSFIPVTLNYRAAFASAGKFSSYLGVGAGVARVDAKIYGTSDKDTTFVAQGFAGVTYQAAQKVSLHLGARYIWMNDVELYGARNIKVGDDVAIEAGISFRF